MLFVWTLEYSIEIFTNWGQFVKPRLILGWGNLQIFSAVYAGVGAAGLEGNGESQVGPGTLISLLVRVVTSRNLAPSLALKVPAQLQALGPAFRAFVRAKSNSL